jgi:hypothetical protein
VVSTESPPGWLTEAVDAVLADLQQPQAIPLEVSYGREQWDSATCWVVHLRELSETGRISFIVPPEERGAALLERFADYLQEQFFPETSLPGSPPSCNAILGRADGHCVVAMPLNTP